MVRILANGDVVPDNDPRAGPAAQQRSGGRHNTNNSNIHSTAPPPADAANQAGQTSMFDAVNQRLHGLGVPSWNAGPYVVEPIVSLGFLLALLFMGIQGLVFAALLFFIVKYSGEAANCNGPPAQGDGANQAAQAASIFIAMNEGLLEAGVPALRLGPFVVEPIVSVTFLLTFIFLYVQQLFLTPILMFIMNCNWPNDYVM